jgi:hypothetical protein
MSLCDSLRFEVLGGRALTAAEQAHIDGCPACQVEARQRAALDALTSVPVPGALAERIRAQARVAMQVPVRPWRTAALTALGLGLIGMVQLPFLGLRPDWDLLAVWGRFACLALLAGSFVAGVAAAFRPGLRLRWALPAAMSVLASAALLVFPGERTTGPVNELLCLFAEWGLALLPLVPLTVVARREELGLGRGAMLGFAAGSVSTALEFLHCPDGRLAHLLSTHLTGWALAVAFGAAVGAWVRPPLWKPTSG